MGSHSVTCHPAEVTFPPLPQPKLVLDLATPEGCKAELGLINASGRVFLSKLGRKLSDQSGDDREISFLFQRLSVMIQWYNAILLHDCFVKEEG